MTTAIGGGFPRFTKAVIIGVLAGVPTSITGTVLGTAVLIIAKSAQSSDKNKKFN